MLLADRGRAAAHDLHPDGLFPADVADLAHDLSPMLFFPSGDIPFRMYPFPPMPVSTVSEIAHPGSPGERAEITGKRECLEFTR